MAMEAAFLFSESGKFSFYAAHTSDHGVEVLEDIGLRAAAIDAPGGRLFQGAFDVAAILLYLEMCRPEVLAQELNRQSK